jgi:hypothetical protein
MSPRHGAWREGLQIRRVAESVLNKKSRTADKVLSSSLGGLGVGLTNPHRKNVPCYEIFQISSNLH